MIYDEISAKLKAAGLKADPASIALWAEREMVSGGMLETVRDFASLLAKNKETSTRETLLKMSRLPSVDLKTFSNFDFTRFGEEAGAVLRSLTSLSFLPQGRNVVLVGDTGTGKTHIAKAIGYEACSHGIKTYFTSFHELNSRITKERVRGTVHAFERTMRSQKCLIIDEVGKDRMDAGNTAVFFNLIEGRAESRSPGSIVMTSNTALDGWKDFFTVDTTTEAILDRIIDRVEYFSLSGASYRGRDRNVHHIKIDSAPLTVSGRR